MPKAETVSTTSRRSFLAAAAVAGAIVAPKVAVAAPAPDAELIRLGQHFDALVHRLAVTMAKLEPLYDEHRRRMDEWKLENPTGSCIDVYDRLWEEVGLNAAYKETDPDDITDEMDPVSRKIMAIPATTLAGLLVKARLAKYVGSEYWDETYEQADWVHLTMRQLCDAVIDMAARVSMPAPVRSGSAGAVI
jgi:hypothetical protein